MADDMGLEKVEYIPARKLRKEEEHEKAMSQVERAGELHIKKRQPSAVEGILHGGYSVARKVGGTAVSGAKLLFARPPQQQQQGRQPPRRMPPRRALPQQPRRIPPQQPRSLFASQLAGSQRQQIPESVLRGFGMPVPKVLRAKKRRSRRRQSRRRYKGKEIHIIVHTR